MWWMLVGAAIAGKYGNMGTTAAAKANTRISEANAEAGEKVKVATNAAKAASGSLDRWVQSVNNNRRLKAGGEALEALAVNASRMNDASANRNLATSIRAAEQQGMAAAMQAFSGVGGSVVDAVNTSVALRDSIVNEQIRDSQEMGNYDVARRAGMIMSQTIGGLDQTLIRENLDYTQYYSQVTPYISSFAAAIRNAFPYAKDAMGSMADQTTSTELKQEYGKASDADLSSRFRSSSQYDLADYAYDSKQQKFKFGFDTSASEEKSIYDLWSNTTVYSR